MAAWKQIVVAVVVLAAAGGLWAKFFPGAPQMLARIGIDWPQPASARTAGGLAGSGSSSDASAERADLPLIVAAPVATATINDRLQAIGSGRSKATVTVNPYASGRLTELLVQSGAHIQAGDVIGRLDSETEKIALDRAIIARDDAAAKLERIRKLRSSNAATTVDLTNAESELRNDELAVHDAQVTLDRRTITSPISGVVGILPIAAGNYVTSQSAIATIDDRSSILVDFWVPERFAPAVRVGAEIEANPLANPKAGYKGTVTAIDNHIDAASRTLWVQATIANPSDSLRAGMSFEVTMKFPGDTYPSVSPLAIQWDTEGSFIWAVDNGKTRRVPVRVVQRNADAVLIDADIATGNLVVTEGVQGVREGGEVRMAGSGAQQQAANVGGT